MTEDEKFMGMALNLACSAAGRTSPNPQVGALVVKGGQIVGQGCHLCAGSAHAEIHALGAAGPQAEGATLYVTLEPCSHHGRTGPCADAVIAAGIKRVVVAMTDPNPQVSGQGLARLRAAGIQVEEGVLACVAAQQNEAFIKWISTRMPFVILKSAMTLDGKIATYQGISKWITGERARLRVHELRNTCDAIMVGIGTVIADDPELTTRLPQGGRNPLRVIVDSQARTPLTAKVVMDRQALTVIAVAEDASPDKVAALKAKGVQVWPFPRGGSGVDLRQLFAFIGNQQISTVLLEGGATLNAAALAANLVDKVQIFIAPKFVGGTAAPGPVGGQGIASLDQAIGLENLVSEQVGDDLLITAYVKAREGRNVYRTCGRIGTG